VIFNRLGRNEIGKIVEIQIARLVGRLEDRKISLKLSKVAKEFLAERGYDPLFGARPLKRTIQGELENPLAKLIIAGKISEGDSVTADRNPADKASAGSKEDGLTFKKSGSAKGE
jgi:ATP-dependent Clp protease ATP-binding subunit ClpB